MKKYTKTVVVAGVMFAVSAVGFGVAFGYGGGGVACPYGYNFTTFACNLAPVVTPPAAGRVLGAATFQTDLRQGMTGEAVRQLQETLRAAGFFTYPVSTGFFGPVTAAALRAYQAAQGVGATGEVLGASNYIFGGNLSQGSTGDAVKQLQERLRAGRYFTHPTSTGYFGAITTAALRIYQAENGLPQTGSLDAATIALLNQ